MQKLKPAWQKDISKDRPKNAKSRKKIGQICRPKSRKKIGQICIIRQANDTKNGQN